MRNATKSKMEPCKTFLLNKIFKRNLNFLKTQAALFLTNSELIEVFIYSSPKFY